jgi:hypothetical protein
VTTDGFEQREDERARELAMLIDAETKAELVILARNVKQDLRVVFLDKDGKEDFVVNTKSIEDEVLFNVNVMKLIAENPDVEKDKRFWCDSCKDGEYFWCEYATKSGEVTMRMSCAEYEVEKKKQNEKYAPFTAQTVGEIGKKSNEKKTTPITIQPITGSDWRVAPAKKEEKPKTGFQLPAKGTSSLPFDLLYRCPNCWHWFKSEQKLATHAQWACPGRDKNKPENQTFLIECAEGCCTGGLDAMLLSKKPPTAEKSTGDTSSVATGPATENKVQGPSEKDGGKEDHLTK